MISKVILEETEFKFFHKFSFFFKPYRKVTQLGIHASHKLAVKQKSSKPGSQQQ